MKRILFQCICIAIALVFTECGLKQERRLIIAAGEGDMGTVRELLAEGVYVNGKTGIFDYTALYSASYYGHANIAEVLLENGADVNAETGNGWTALRIASQEGYIDVVKILLGYGADVNAESRGGSTALYMATQEGHTDIVQMLKNAGAEE